MRETYVLLLIWIPRVALFEGFLAMVQQIAQFPFGHELLQSGEQQHALLESDWGHRLDIFQFPKTCGGYHHLIQSQHDEMQCQGKL